MSVIFSEILTDFINNQSVKSSASLTFNTGCVYDGVIKDNQACGYGKFIWSDSEFFEGFFNNGLRVKIGHQKWSDGDEFIGEFFKDKRHGWGFYKWWNSDTYEGSFYEDMRHGFGIYKSNNGCVYEGTFYQNKREGFGTLKYACGNVFQGLYKDNYRCGPGILTYQNGCQDIGLWHRGSLLKLIINKDDVFQMSQFADLTTLYPNSTLDKQSVGTPTATTTSEDNVSQYLHDDILKYKLTKPKNIIIFLKDTSDNTDSSMEKNVIAEPCLEGDCQPILSELEEQDPIIEAEPTITIELIDAEEFIDPHNDEQRHETLLVDESFAEFLSSVTETHNTTPIIQKMRDHLMRFANRIPQKCHENVATDINVVVRDVVTNIFTNPSSTKVPIDRSRKYGAPGDMELKSNQIITWSHQGNLEEIRKLFTDIVHPNANVTDCRGSFSLLEATLNWNTDLINYLLDCGSDVNQITDEGISALGSCFLFYYPQKGFIHTIAEGVVELSYTPVNFNGVRREPIKNPNLQTDVLVDTNNGHDNDVLHPTVVEQWNDYQKPLLPLNAIDINLPNHNTKAEFLSNSWKDNHSTDFESYRNNIEFPTKVGAKLLEKAASVLSNNSLMMQRQPRPNSRNQGLSTDEGTARFKALQIARQHQMLQVIRLLLRRGADPNICKIPFPALFFAVKCGDIEMTKVLICKGANVNARLGGQNDLLTPLHIAACLPGKKGIVITELLLMNGADPNGRALDDESFLDKTLIDEWSKDIISEEQLMLLGGKTALHLACSRYDDFKVSHQIVQLLLEYGANPNLICNGHTSLTLAIASGNDLIVDKLLSNEKLDINLPLTHGLGNAVCVASSTVFEHTRTIESRVALIKKLISAKADLIRPVSVGPRRNLGAAVDYAYNVFYLDQRVSRLPYHALTAVERDLFNNRKHILSYMGMFTRECAVENEKIRLESLKIEGIKSRGPSPDFVYTGAGADPETQRQISKALSKISQNMSSLDFQMQGSDLLARKPLFKYCYECGRSINVKLTACTRCKEVYFCSKLCKTKAWNTRHKFECLRVGGRVSNADSDQQNNRNTDSPTPATIMNEVGLTNAKADLKKIEIVKPKKKTNTQELDLAEKVNALPRKLPPLDNNTNHPSYSYTYVMDDYIKFDQQDKLIVLDNYSFV